MRLSEYETLYAERAGKFMLAHPDFREVVNRADIPLNAHVQLELKARDDGPSLAYWLGKNPEAARRIAEMPPFLALDEILKHKGKT